MAALARAAAELRPRRDLPREREESLCRGAAVVADLEPGMLPYFADVAHLVEQVRHVVGAPNTSVSWPHGETVDDLAAATRTEHGNQPVLIISSLGRDYHPSGALSPGRGHLPGHLGQLPRVATGPGLRG